MSPGAPPKVGRSSKVIVKFPISPSGTLQVDEVAVGPVEVLVGPIVDVVFGNGVTENGADDDDATGTIV